MRPGNAWTMRAPALGLHGPEHAGCAQPPEHREYGEVGHAPRGAKEARGAPGGEGDGLMTLDDLPLGLAGPAEPETPVTPGVIAEVVALVDDPPRELGGTGGAPADQEEGRGHALACQDIQHAGRVSRVGAIIECERRTILRPATAPDATRAEQIGAPRVRRPECGRRDEPDRGGGHDARSRATPCPASTSSTISAAARGRR